WAVAGPDPYLVAAGLAAAGAQVTSYPDLAGLAAAIGGGGPGPGPGARTAPPRPGGLGAGGEAAGVGEGAAGGRRGGGAREAGVVVGGVQEGLGGAGGGARLGVLARAGVPARPGDLAGGLAGSAVWGLVRSVQAENPCRVVLADLPARDPAGDGPALL